MSASNFATSNATFRKLMGNGLTYQIPRFQRDYSWEAEHWEDLWLDIQETLREGGEPAHYMGYLVLQSTDDKQHNVIDGQQRMTTLSLIILAVLRNLQRLIEKNIDAENNTKRLDQIRQTHIGYLDPVTLVSRSKLTLNRNNDQYYQNYLVPLPETMPQRGFLASEHRLRRAIQWFEKRIAADYLKGHSDPHGVVLASLVEGISDKLFFTVITVTDELNAYKVFETLNARGVRLSSTDLLKNYLFSILHGEERHEYELNNLEERWENIVGRLGSESFPDFLRSHWNSHNATVRKTELFKTIRNKVKTYKEAFAILRNMEEDVETYLGLTEPEGSDWPAESRKHAALLKMFRVRQPYSLLLAAKRRFNITDFERLLRVCMIISFRYNVIGNLVGREQERVYGQLAIRINENAQITLQEVIVSMRDIYPDDDQFQHAFSIKSIRISRSTRNRRVVRYILVQLEKNSEGVDLDFDSKSISVEHILPRNPDRGWETFCEAHEESMVDRLGNMVLVASGVNQKALQNKPWPEKQAILEGCRYYLARRVAQENSNWTPDRMEVHQNWKAKQATAIWRVSQLD